METAMTHSDLARQQHGICWLGGSRRGYVIQLNISLHISDLIRHQSDLPSEWPHLPQCQSEFLLCRPASDFLPAQAPLLLPPPTSTYDSTITPLDQHSIVTLKAQYCRISYADINCQKSYQTRKPYLSN